MFTSKYTTEHGAVSGDPTMDESPDWVTLPEILMELGYSTYALSANPVVALNVHNTTGFQEYYTVDKVRDSFALLRLIKYVFGLDEFNHCQPRECVAMALGYALFSSFQAVRFDARLPIPARCGRLWRAGDRDSRLSGRHTRPSGAAKYLDQLTANKETYDA